MTDKILYDRKSAAHALSVSVRTIDYLLAAGEFETRRIGKKVLITRASLLRFAQGNHYESPRDLVSPQSTLALAA
jgi:excisionase family DNA binding protein